MRSPVSARVKGVPLSGIRVIFEKANQLSDVIRLEVGEPDFDTPSYITAAAKEALDGGFTHYTPNTGIAPLREAIAKKLRRDNGIDVDPASEIVVTPGAGPAVCLSLISILDPGDEVLVPNPTWPHYAACVALADGKTIRYPTNERMGYGLETEKISKLVTKRTKVIVVNSPSNPMGSILTKSDLEGIAELAIERDLIVLSDEIYEKIIYDGNVHYSIASFSGMKERTITVNGCSKAYAMTGWRIGYAATRSDIVSEMAKLNLYASGGSSSITQKAALKALSGPQDDLARMVGEYSNRRKRMVKRLNEMPGVSCPTPSGAFYTFPRVSLRGLSSYDISMLLLDEARVATVPGSSFGNQGEGHLRLSYATTIDKIDEAMDRIARTIGGLEQSATERAR